MPDIPDIPDPHQLFTTWLDEARERLGDESATAFTLATANAQGIPSARIVLLKGISPQGYAFYTNTGSNKARDLAQNPHAAMCFYWEPFGRQVRIQGHVTPVTDAEADAYFSTRPRDSQLGAWASRQSERLESRKALLDRVQTYAEQFVGDIPRPEYWTGYLIHPNRYEFWLRADHRLHDRRLYLKNDQSTWDSMLLSP